MEAEPVVPEGVRRKALALGVDGRRWMASLSSLLEALEVRWAITVGPGLGGSGSVAYLAEATAADGSPAVLKVAMPDGLVGNGEWRRELDAIRFGQGRGYVELLAFDVEDRAMLLERLGTPIAELDLPIETQIDAIALTLERAWARPPDASQWRTGAQQAAFLHRYIDEWWGLLGHPCDRTVVDEALACVRRRADAFRADAAVLVHGDAHAWNVLLHPAGGYRLIDPDAMLSEPAHDLAIPLRHWNAELLIEPEPVDRVRSWCEGLQRATGVDAQAVWEWAFAERVSTGLFLLRLGDESGRASLEVAALLAT